MDSGSGVWRMSTLDQNENCQLDGQVVNWGFHVQGLGQGHTAASPRELLRFARDEDNVIVGQH
jgi:hypothetical protein